MINSLIITSSGGSGHRQVSTAIHEKLENTPLKIKEIDVMRSGCSFGKIIGKKCTDFWDEAQKKGDILTQVHLVKLQPIAEALFFLSTFFTIARALLKPLRLPEQVICTQPLNLFAITSAVRFANWYRKGKGKIQYVDLYITDLPTKKAVHFLKSLKRLNAVSKKCFKLIRLHTPQVFSSNGISTEEFWQMHTSLQSKQIVECDFPLSKAYTPECIHLLPMPASNATIDIQLFTDNEHEKMRNLCPDMQIADKISFNILPRDHVGILMLGSCPEQQAVLNYVHAMIAASKKSVSFERPSYYFFVGCGGQSNGKNSLYSRVCRAIIAAKLNSRIKIIPFIGQPVASFFARSDMSITRSGGSTSGELIALKKRKNENKKIFIHSLQNRLSNIQDRKKTRKELLEKIPLWENGNAKYLCLNYGAEIINPTLAEEEFQSFFR